MNQWVYWGFLEKHGWLGKLYHKKQPSIGAGSTRLPAWAFCPTWRQLHQSLLSWAGICCLSDLGWVPRSPEIFRSFLSFVHLQSLPLSEKGWFRSHEISEAEKGAWPLLCGCIVRWVCHVRAEGELCFLIDPGKFILKKLSQWDSFAVKPLVTQPDNLSSVSAIHMGEGENWLLQVVLWPLCIIVMDTHTK